MLNPNECSVATVIVLMMPTSMVKLKNVNYVKVEGVENIMSGKPNDKWLVTMINKLGSREAVTARQQAIGALGGKKGTTGGFWANRELAREAGRIGGLKSRRGPKNNG